MLKISYTILLLITTANCIAQEQKRSLFDLPEKASNPNNTSLKVLNQSIATMQSKLQASVDIKKMIKARKDELRNQLKELGVTKQLDAISKEIICKLILGRDINKTNINNLCPPTTQFILSKKLAHLPKQLILASEHPP